MQYDIPSSVFNLCDFHHFHDMDVIVMAFYFTVTYTSVILNNMNVLICFLLCEIESPHSLFCLTVLIGPEKKMMIFPCNF